MINGGKTMSKMFNFNIWLGTMVTGIARTLTSCIASALRGQLKPTQKWALCKVVKLTETTQGLSGAKKLSRNSHSMRAQELCNLPGWRKRLGHFQLQGTRGWDQSDWRTKWGSRTKWCRAISAQELLTWWLRMACTLREDRSWKLSMNKLITNNTLSKMLVKRTRMMRRSRSTIGSRRTNSRWCDKV